MHPARSGVPGGQQRIGEWPVLSLPKGTNFELGGRVAARFFFLVPTFHVGMQPARSGVPEGQQRIEERLVLSLSKGTNFELGGRVATQFFLWGRTTD